MVDPLDWLKWLLEKGWGLLSEHVLTLTDIPYFIFNFLLFENKEIDRKLFHLFDYIMFPLYFIIFNINAEPHSFEYINFVWTS